MTEVSRKKVRISTRRTAQIAQLTGVLLLCAAGCGQEPAPPQADAGASGFELVAHRQSGALAAGTAVTMRNTLGDLRVRNQPGEEYLLTAQIQKLNGETRDVEFLETLSDERLTIDVVAPDGFDGRVDAALLVPDTHAITLVTDSGLIQARVNENAIDAKSVSGKIAVRALEDLKLETVDGPIELTVHRLGTGDAELKTTSGKVTVQMPPESNFVLTAKTKGTFSTALAPEVKRATKQSSGKLELKLGDGKSRIRIDSDHGDVLLRSYGYEAGQP